MLMSHPFSQFADICFSSLRCTAAIQPPSLLQKCVANAEAETPKRTTQDVRDAKAALLHWCNANLLTEAKTTEFDQRASSKGCSKGTY